jgi:hypothetical protein
MMAVFYASTCWYVPNREICFINKNFDGLDSYFLSYTEFSNCLSLFSN